MSTKGRLCSYVILAVTLLLAVSGTALAKGPGLDHAVLDGPGIDRPIFLRDRYPYLLNRTVLSLAFGSSHDRDIGRARPLTSEPGPRFRLAYHMGAGSPIVVDLYPYASGGPLAFAPAGQAIAVGIGRTDQEQRFAVNPGWYDFPRGLLSQLRDQGLPSEAVAAISGWQIRSGLVVLAALTLSGLLILRRTRPLRGNQVSPNVNPSSSACGRRAQ